MRRGTNVKENKSKESKTFIYVGILLLAAFIGQDVLPLKWAWLEAIQQNETYKQLTGFVLFLFIAEQWYLSILRAKGKTQISRRFITIHKYLGVLAPVFFYVHATQLGHAYLLLLSLVYLSNAAMGYTHHKYWNIKSKYYSYFWMITHVSLSVFVVVLMAYHIFIAFYYT